MKNITVNFNKNGVCRLQAYLHDPYDEMGDFKTRPAVVVCPGGGYSYCSPREADPIALRFSAAGFHTFVFYYSCGDEAPYPTQLCELSAAMQYIRRHAEEWNVIPDQIAVCGFSAGGHLAASLATQWNSDLVAARTGITDGSNQPNATVLGYPVITTSWMDGCGATGRISGRDPEMAKRLNLHKFVGPHTCPSFLFHTWQDNAVPMEDSLLYAGALSKYDIPFELHIFQDGCHGMSTASPLTGTYGEGIDGLELHHWMDLACHWLWHLFGMPGVPAREAIRRCHPSAGNEI